MSSHPCAERLLLPEALSGRLDPAEENRVMAHLETCSACLEAADDIEVALVSLATLRVARDEAGVAPAAVGLASTSSVAAMAGPGPTIDLRGTDDLLTSAAEPTAAHLHAVQPNDLEPPAVVIAFGPRHPVRRALLGVAAAVVLLAAGAVVGHQLLPPRDTAHYGPPVALAPPAGASSVAATGSAKVANEGNALEVRLTASSLPAAGWYECVWSSDGQTRSAGSFRATNGAVDVELRVAPPKQPGAWELQVVAHNGTSSQVVLEGTATAPS